MLIFLLENSPFMAGVTKGADRISLTLQLIAHFRLMGVMTFDTAILNGGMYIFLRKLLFLGLMADRAKGSPTPFNKGGNK